MPWLCLTVRLRGSTYWRSQAGAAWAVFPRVALRGLFDRWTEGTDGEDGPHEYLVALLQPWAAALFFGVPAAETRNRITDLEALASRAAQFDVSALLRDLHATPTPREQIAVLEHYLQRAMNGAHFPRAPLLRGMEQLYAAGGAMSLIELGDVAGLSARRVQSGVRASTACNPKGLAQLARFATALHGLHTQPWQVCDPCVAESGYFDHSHRIREFRRFAGVTPSVYSERKRLDPRTVFTL